MASRTAQNIGHQAGEITGQAQVKKDETMNQASQGTNTQSSDQNSSIASQATNFLQQTGEQVKNMAQGAADAVKNTLGMNNDNSSNAPSTNHPSNPSPRT
ncbi:late embryogenesis abundant protein 2-like [Herrania umbratica]|uniref:Late embryogenesis abundant protein 2-like n=1 Tax=Herrania umbratica TaxID=108875 RepID=A0A6J1BHF2_9ROSI|nr:late embryogenesis abundant protein 2-like [Herrania umbratica]